MQFHHAHFTHRRKHFRQELILTFFGLSQVKGNFRPTMTVAEYAPIEQLHAVIAARQADDQKLQGLREKLSSDRSRRHAELATLRTQAHKMRGDLERGRLLVQTLEGQLRQARQEAARDLSKIPQSARLSIELENSRIAVAETGSVLDVNASAIREHEAEIEKLDFQIAEL